MNKNSLSMNHIPPEIVEKFLLGLDPVLIRQLSTLCRSFYLATNSASFALFNLRQLYPITKQYNTFSVRDCFLTSDLLLWDRFHQRQLRHISIRPHFPVRDKWKMAEYIVDFSNSITELKALAVAPSVPICWFPCIQVLILDNNCLRGPIPPELGELAKLGTLSLRGNKLSGSIPLELGKLSNLFRLNLSHNRLDGCIPPDLWPLFQHLQWVDLSDNQLEGWAPHELMNLTSPRRYVTVDVGIWPLFELRLANNRLTGNFIDTRRGWENRTRLRVLDLSGNLFEGQIEGWIGDLGDLEILNLSRNQLTGCIPSELGKLTQLVELNLSGNRLTGLVPEELDGLEENIRLLDLCENSLDGGLPMALHQVLEGCRDWKFVRDEQLGYYDAALFD
ncbi:UNVERIFIED_CONTAM: hypothetical protein HDU68_007732 [Siphonaria sp. JEL0065]|nr:hypothetical protein HDU68_007732 [Siphonaria sp. JEL0065]